jgi:hypothetical protein
LAAYCAALFGREVFGPESNTFGRSLRRGSTILFGVACCASVVYGTDHHWVPWPPDIFVMISTDLYLVSVIIAAARQNRAFG